MLPGSEAVLCEATVSTFVAFTVRDAPLIAPDAGGHIWFVPIWTIGLVLTAIGGMFWLGWL